MRFLQTLEEWLRVTWDLRRVSAYKNQVIYPVMFLHSYGSVFQASSDLLLFDHGSLRGHSGIRLSISKLGSAGVRKRRSQAQAQARARVRPRVRERVRGGRAGAGGDGDGWGAARGRAHARERAVQRVDLGDDWVGLVGAPEPIRGLGCGVVGEGHAREATAAVRARHGCRVGQEERAVRGGR